MEKRYRLQKVLELRERAEQEALRHVKDCLERLEERQAELERRKEMKRLCVAEREAVRERFSRESAGGTTLATMQKYQLYIEDLRRRESMIEAEINVQQRLVAQAESEHSRAVAAASEARSASRVIEVHKDKWSERQRRSALQREQRGLDETSTARWSKERRDA